MIYKICHRDEWESAVDAGVFRGSPVDLADGFIHFSAAHQVKETAARHFAGLSDLVLIEVDDLQLNEQQLKWEPSRGGDLFPHLYGHLNTDDAVRVMPLPLSSDCSHNFDGLVG